jgi:hypothetical protein
MGLILTGPGNAQTVVTINNGNRPLVSGPPQTVTITVQLNMPASGIASSADMTKAIAGTTQSLYDIVNHECEVLTEALKGACRLIRLNVGGNLNDPNSNLPTFGNRQNASPIVSANANATFEIDLPTPKASDTAEPPAANARGK